MSLSVPLSVSDVKHALSDIVDPQYDWPEQLAGWQLEFIAYPDGEIIMDFLHPVSGSFWSDENTPLDLPKKNDGSEITWRDLKRAGIPFMTTFGYAALSKEPPQPHLTSVKK